jgi:hypothetical protein
MSDPNRPGVSASVGFEARYLWVNISGGAAPPLNSVNYVPLSGLNVPLTPALGYPFAQPFIESKRIGIPPNAETLEYAPATKCIYCGVTKYSDALDRDLGEEHIIPGSLGAALIIPKASCHNHERITSGIETKIVSELFDATRKHKDIRAKGRKPILKGNFKIFRTVDGQDFAFPMPIKDHPTVLFLPYFGPPGILTGRPRSLHGIAGACLININAETSSIKKLRISQFSTPVLDSLLFARLLAKIGYAFAAAEILPENFDSLVTEFIDLKTAPSNIDNLDIRDYFVGGDTSVHRAAPWLHQLGLGLYPFGRRMFIVATIRLFAFLGTPVFYVAVGTVPPSKSSVVIERLSQNNSRTHDL